MNYYCPSCTKKLEWGGNVQYHMLHEHVSNPNVEPPFRAFHYCDNERCNANSTIETNTRHILLEKFVKTDPNFIAVFWDSDGAIYGICPNIKFIDNNEGAFGSFERKFNVERRKSDENRTIFKMFGVLIKVVYKYKGDSYGLVLSKKKKYEVYVKNGIGYRMVHNPFNTLLYYRRKFKK